LKSAHNERQLLVLDIPFDSGSRSVTNSMTIFTANFSVIFSLLAKMADVHHLSCHVCAGFFVANGEENILTRGDISAAGISATAPTKSIGTDQR
jgi:hypothetical protein